MKELCHQIYLELNKFGHQTVSKASLTTILHLPNPKRHIKWNVFIRSVYYLGLIVPKRHINQVFEFCPYTVIHETICISTWFFPFELNLGLGFSKFFFSSPIESGFSFRPEMRALQESLTLSSLSNSDPRFYDWLFECHGFWHNVALIIPSLLFILYLSFQAKKSFSKLSHGRSYVIIAYYACLWLVSLFNLIWCCFQVLCFAIIE